MERNLKKTSRIILSWILTCIVTITLIPIMGETIAFAADPVTFTREDAYLDTGWGDDEYTIYIEYDASGTVTDRGIVISDDFGYSERVNRTPLEPERSGEGGFATCIYALEDDGRELSADLNDRILTEGVTYHWYAYVICNGVEYTSPKHTIVFSRYGSRFINPTVTFTREDAFFDTSWGDDEFNIYLEYNANETVTDRGIVILNDSGYIEWVDRSSLEPEEPGEGGFATCVYAIGEYGESSGDLGSRILTEGETYYWYPYVVCDENMYVGNRNSFVFSTAGSRFTKPENNQGTNIDNQNPNGVLPFTDVPKDAWYYGDVKSAYDTGLINGMDATTFAPNSNMTYAQAVKLAACMHQKYTTGSVSLKNGSVNWWDPYLEYARNKNIIKRNFDWNSKATRAGYVEIFARALPDAAFRAKNSIIDGSIPDIGMSHPQAAAIYKLYRAGILTGMDKEGTFSPDSNIKRSEVSAILTRMMNESARKNLTLDSSTIPNNGSKLNAYRNYLTNLMNSSVKESEGVYKVTDNGDVTRYKYFAIADFNSDGIDDMMVYSESEGKNANSYGNKYEFFTKNSSGNVISMNYALVPYDYDPDNLCFYANGVVALNETDMYSCVTGVTSEFNRKWEIQSKGEYLQFERIGDTDQFTMAVCGVFDAQNVRNLSNEQLMEIQDELYGAAILDVNVRNLTSSNVNSIHQ